MKKIFLISFFCLFNFFFILNSAWANGLVPCGEEGNPCKFCHFFVMIDIIIDFILFKIVPPLAILMVVIAGIMFMFAYFGGAEMLPGGAKGGPALLNQAKKLITSVIIGLVIIYAAWLIINTFFMLIGVEEWTGLKEGWWKIECK